MSLELALILALLCHLIGDYVLQSAWMAEHKVRPDAKPDGTMPYSVGESRLAALAHGITYTLPFVAITQSPWALLVIGGTHAVLDHYRVAKRVVWLRNQLAPKRDDRPSWEGVRDNQGSPEGTPSGLALALLIIVDNTIHLIINAAAIGLFG